MYFKNFLNFQTFLRQIGLHRNPTLTKNIDETSNACSPRIFELIKIFEIKSKDGQIEESLGSKFDYFFCSGHFLFVSNRLFLVLALQYYKISIFQYEDITKLQYSSHSDVQ